jgi:hypothetical protein
MTSNDASGVVWTLDAFFFPSFFWILINILFYIQLLGYKIREQRVKWKAVTMGKGPNDASGEFFFFYIVFWILIIVLFYIQLVGYKIREQRVKWKAVTMGKGPNDASR